MARKKSWRDVYLTGEEVELANFDILAEYPPTNISCPYFVKFKNHSKLRGSRAQKLEVVNGRLRWLPRVENARWCSVAMEHVEFIRVSVNLDIDMNFDVEF